MLYQYKAVTCPCDPRYKLLLSSEGFEKNEDGERQTYDPGTVVGPNGLSAPFNTVVETQSADHPRDNAVSDWLQGEATAQWLSFRQDVVAREFVRLQHEVMSKWFYEDTIDTYWRGFGEGTDIDDIIIELELDVLQFGLQVNHGVCSVRNDNDSFW